MVEITYDNDKRQRTWVDRGIDFADAVRVFAGEKLEYPDLRFDYGEERMITVGLLQKRMVIVVWTQRGSNRHIISMRKANEREQRKFRDRLR